MKLEANPYYSWKQYQAVMKEQKASGSAVVHFCPVCRRIVTDQWFVDVGKDRYHAECYQRQRSGGGDGE